MGGDRDGHPLVTHDVTRKTAFKFRIYQGVATVFDHEGLAGEALYVRQRFDETAGDGFGCLCGFTHGIGCIGSGMLSSEWNAQRRFYL